MMTAFAIVRCPSHSFPNLMALVAASAFAPTASKVARTANRSRNMTILGLAKRHKSITTPPDLATMCAASLPTSGLFLASRGLIREKTANVEYWLGRCPSGGHCLKQKAKLSTSMTLAQFDNGYWYYDRTERICGNHRHSIRE